MPKSVKPLSPEEEELQHKKEEFEAVLDTDIARLERELMAFSTEK